MAICYDKLFHLLIDKKISQNELIKGAGVSANILTRLKRNEYISMESIEKICNFLSCTPNDILEFTSGINTMNVIDLFAGCGGLSLGFEMAGFNIPLAVERDAWAAETYAHNHSHTKVVTQDITQIFDFNNLLAPSTIIDGIIGGPPCQGFSLSGNRDKNDPRNSLFMDFVRFVKHYNPKFFVMENVSGILSMVTKNGELVKDVILKEYDKAGYNVEIFQLNASEFGVPQSRIRVFFIGLRKDIVYNKEALEPRGFLFGNEQITIRDAIMDLPQIQAGEGNEESSYDTEPTTEYQMWARGNCSVLHNHVTMRHTPRLIERFSKMSWGQSVSDITDDRLKQRKRNGNGEISDKPYDQNNRRMHPNKICHTITATFYGNFVHPYKNRNFTAREGARIQSFPDRYVFLGKPTVVSKKLLLKEGREGEAYLCQYSQIGNAVPPLMARAIATNLINQIDNRKEK